jgi:MFS family permease
MELDDLKIAWAHLEDRVEKTESLVRRDYTARRLNESRRALRGLTWGQAAQVLAWIGVAAIVAPFWIEHRHVPHLLVAGLALHLFAIAIICTSVMQILLIGRAFYTAPVVTIQRRLAELHRFRVVSSLGLGLLWWVMWVAATMVGAQLWFGVDLYRESPRWIQMALGLGVAGMGVSVLLARCYAKRAPASPFLRRLIDDLAGHNLLRATRRLEEISGFEQG